MRNAPFPTRTLLACGACATLPLIAFAPRATAGELFLLGAVPWAYAWDCSDDGSIVVGQDSSTYWTWTRDAWVVPIEGSTPPGNGVGGQPRISADGIKATISAINPDTGKAEAALYDTWLNEWSFIGDMGYNCDIERSAAWGMTRSGAYVAGSAWIIGCDTRGYVYDVAADVMTSLPIHFFLQSARANSVSEDGSIAAGWNDTYTGYRQAAVWTRQANGTYTSQAIYSSPNVAAREATVVSGNGQWVYGIGRASVDGGAPWRWSAATGYQSMPNPPVAAEGFVVDANFDGSRVLCFFGLLGGSGGYLWSADSGWKSINDLADESGAVTDGWSLSMPLGMSEDGLTIVGTAWGSVASTPFVLDLHPGVCQADLDDDGTVDAADLAIVLGNWGVPGGFGDINHDGDVDGGDLSILLSSWGGC